MHTRTKAPSIAVPPTLLRINQDRTRMPKRKTRSSVRPIEPRRKFRPNVNHSFAEYNDSTASTQRSNYDVVNLPKGRNVSLGEIDVSRKLSSHSRRLSSVERLEQSQVIKQISEVTGRDRLMLNKAQVLSTLEKSQALLERAKSEMKLGQFAEALRLFNKVLKVSATHSEALYSRAICYMHLKQHRMAIPDLLTLVKDSPLYDRQVYFALAVCFITANDVKAAVRHLSNGLAKFPKFAEARLLRGQLYLSLHITDRALHDFSATLKLDAEEGAAFIGIGDICQSTQDLTAAEVAYSSAVNCKRSNLEGLLRRASLFFDQGSDDSALHDLDQV